MSTETSEDLVKRLMSEIRAHGKAMEASSTLPYERRDSGPGREEVRDVDIYDNNATFVIRKPVDRKSDHTFLTVNGLANGKVSSSVYQNNNHHQQQTPILSTFLSRPQSNSISTPLTTTSKYTGPSLTTTTIPSSFIPTTSPPTINRNYVPPQIIATTSSGTNGLTSQLTTIANGNVNLIKGESDVSCYSSISSTAAAATGTDQLIRGSRLNQVKTSTGQLMCDQTNEPPHCPSCGVHLGSSDSEQVSNESYTIPNGIKSSNRPHGNDRFHQSNGHSVIKCDLIGSHCSPDDPPRYSPCRLQNGQANGYHPHPHHHHHHHSHNPHHLQERIGSKVILSLPKVPLISKSNQQGGKKVKTKTPLKYIKKVQRCPGCAGKCYIEPVQRSVGHLSLSTGDNQLFTLYCPSCSKTGLARFKGSPENGNYYLNGTIDKHLTYYSALPRLWDTEMWHRKRKRASIKKNEKILIVFTSIVSLIIFITLTYLGVTTFQKITQLPKIG